MSTIVAPSSDDPLGTRSGAAEAATANRRRPGRRRFGVILRCRVRRAPTHPRGRGKVRLASVVLPSSSDPPERDATEKNYRTFLAFP